MCGNESTPSTLHDRANTETSEEHMLHSMHDACVPPSQHSPSPRRASPHAKQSRLALHAKQDMLFPLNFLGPLHASSIVPPLPDDATMFEFFKPASEEDVDWTQDDTTKPPFEYLTLIYRAVKASGRERCTLNEIYTYIQDNFLYYRKCDPGWKV
jgi:hypothetical protein